VRSEPQKLQHFLKKKKKNLIRGNNRDRVRVFFHDEFISLKKATMKGSKYWTSIFSHVCVNIMTLKRKPNCVLFINIRKKERTEVEFEMMKTETILIYYLNCS